MALLRRSDSGTITEFPLLGDGKLSILRQLATENLLGEEETSTYHTVLPLDFAAEIRGDDDGPRRQHPVTPAPRAAG